MPTRAAEPFRLICTDCAAPCRVAEQICLCSGCGRSFEWRQGYFDLLPSRLANEEFKAREREGWMKSAAYSLDQVRADFLRLPEVAQVTPSNRHFLDAAFQFRAVLSYLEPVAGKRGLDLGGAMGWAAWRFAQRGARMALADFNERAPIGLDGAEVYLQTGTFFDRFRVDAEQLPFASDQFDFVFTSAFLHHMSNPAAVVREIARVLRPGGVYFACMEGFWPIWMSHRRAFGRADEALRNIELGINEQVFRWSAYQAWFRRARLRVCTVNPRWDQLTSGTITWSRHLKNADYTPEILTNRAAGTSISGKVARWFLKNRFWRSLAHPTVLPITRWALFQLTQKHRILIGHKL